MKKSHDNEGESTNSESASIIKFNQLRDKFYQKWREVAPELEELGIAKGELHLSDTVQISTLERATAQLEAFAVCEALTLFRQAAALRPPGILAMWARDDLTRGARETKIYLTARKLVRDAYRADYSNLRRLIKRSYSDNDTAPHTSGGRESGARGASDGCCVYDAEKHPA